MLVIKLNRWQFTPEGWYYLLISLNGISSDITFEEAFEGHCKHLFRDDAVIEISSTGYTFY